MRAHGVGWREGVDRTIARMTPESIWVQWFPAAKALATPLRLA